MSLAMAAGARLSVPLGMTPCGSSEPKGTRTVSIEAGTSSPNSCQQSRLISRVVGGLGAGLVPPLGVVAAWGDAAAATVARAAARTRIAGTRMVFLMAKASLLSTYYANSRLL